MIDPIPIPLPQPPPLPLPGPGQPIPIPSPGQIVPAPEPEPAPAPVPAPGIPIPLPPPPAAPSGGVPPMPDWGQFLIWIGALTVLWFLLSAASEAGYGQLANSFAGLLVFGAALFMGPTAVTNAQALIQPRKKG